VGGLVGAGFQHVEAFAERAPADDLDIHVAGAPAVHEAGGGLVDVDGAGADEGAAVVIHDVDGGAVTLDLKDGAKRKDGPVCGGAADLAGIQPGADGGAGTVLDVIGLGVGVGRGADFRDELSGTGSSGCGGLGVGLNRFEGAGEGVGAQGGDADDGRSDQAGMGVVSAHFGRRARSGEGARMLPRCAPGSSS